MAAGAKTLALCALLVLTFTANVSAIHDHACTDLVDILLVIDASASISERDFEALKSKLGHLVGKTYYKLDVNYAFIQFGTFVNEVMSFQVQLDPVIVSQFLLFYDGQQSYLNRALAEARVLFQPSHGARPDAVKYIVVFTDGNPKLPPLVLEETTKLKEMGVQLIAVGVGRDVNMQGMREMGTDGLIYDGSDMQQLEAMFEDIYTSITNYAAEICMACPSKGDVVLALDRSKTLSSADYEILKQKIANLVSDSFGRLDTKYAFIEFGEDTRATTHLNYMVDPATVASEYLNHTGGSSDILAGLNLVPSQFMSQRGHRMDALKILIIYTDGLNSDVTGGFEKVNAIAQAMKNDGVIIFTVGIGDSRDEANLASLASEGFTFDGSDLASMDDVTQAMNGHMRQYVKESCEAAPCVTPKESDVLFIIDASDSIRESDFGKITREIAKYVDFNGIGGLHSKYAFMTYGFFVAKVSQFSWNFVTPGMVAEYFLFWEGQQSRTEEALKVAPDFFTEANGHRPEAQKIIILVTDGISDHPVWTLAEARTLHLDGYFVYGLGVGSLLDMNALSELTNAQSYPVYNIATDTIPALQMVSDHAKHVVDNLCADPCPVGADILMVLDVSTTITEAAFNELKDTYLPILIDTLDAADLSTAYSFISYSSVPTSHSSFKFVKDMEDENFNAKVAASMMEYPEDPNHESLIGKAMAMARLHITEDYGARPNALPYVFIFSDFAFDQSEKDLHFESMVRLLENVGVTIVDFGFGPSVNSTYMDERAASKGNTYNASPLSTMTAHSETVANSIRERMDILCSK